MGVRGSIRSLVGRGLERSLRALDPVYQRLSPAHATLSLGDTEALFDGDGIHLHENRYTYPLESERELIERLRDELRSDDVFWDVGASLGLYAVFAGLDLPEGAVVAFEPFPDDAALTRRNLGLNGLDDRGRVLPVALGSEDRTAWIEAASTKTGRQLVEDGAAAVPATVAPGDAVLGRYDVPPPDVVKIDVEGAEAAVVEGLERTLHDSPPRTVYCEIHRSKLIEFGATRRDVVSSFERHGFDVEPLGERREAEFLRFAR